VIAGIVALSLLPIAGTEAGRSLRIVAGIYTLFVVLANTVVGRRARLVMDLTFALFLASMAWYELLPLGIHGRDAAMYGAIGATVAVLGVMGIGQAEGRSRPAQPSV